MASMTRQELRDYVRNFLDTDSIELPDTIVDVWHDEAVNRIVRASTQWRFYEYEWSLAVVAEQQSYAYSSITDLGFVPADVLTVESDRFMLRPESHERARAAFAGTPASGTPYVFSTYKETMYLWPTPSQAATYTIRGYRAPVFSANAGASPDLPAEFHPLVALYMLVRTYQQQDDDIMSQIFLSNFEEEMSTLRKRYEGTPAVGIVTLGGRCDYQGYTPVSGRLRFDWE